MPPRRTSTRTARTRLPQGQPGIQRFTRSSKPSATVAVEGKEIPGKKTITATATAITAATLLPESPSKKRKLNEIGDGESEGVLSATQRQQQLEEAANATPSKVLRFSSLALSTPRSSRARQPPSPVSQTSSFESSTGRSSPPTSTSRSSSLSPPAPDVSSSPFSHRPAAFDDLLDLHSSFLTAMSLHFAHNGASTPADLRELLPSITRIWKKRKVVVKDLQRLLRIWEDDTESLGPQLRIANYGLGKICLERVSRGSTTDRGHNVSEFNENELQERFVQNLDRIWRQIAPSKDGDRGEVDFVETLGIVPIHDSLTPFTALRKGQQRLQDLRGGVIKTKTAKLKAKGDDTADIPAREPTTDRRRGLLDRIKSKELLQAKLPPLPSKEELVRQAAAERVEDVVRVLALLRPTPSIRKGTSAVTAVQKKPYRFETIIQNVRDSLRSPISDQEVAACLDILQEKDIARDWIEIVTINRLKSVVLKSAGVDVST